MKRLLFLIPCFVVAVALGFAVGYKVRASLGQGIIKEAQAVARSDIELAKAAADSRRWEAQNARVDAEASAAQLARARGELAGLRQQYQEAQVELADWREKFPALPAPDAAEDGTASSLPEAITRWAESKSLDELVGLEAQLSRRLSQTDGLIRALQASGHSEKAENKQAERDDLALRLEAVRLDLAKRGWTGEPAPETTEESVPGPMSKLPVTVNRWRALYWFPAKGNYHWAARVEWTMAHRTPAGGVLLKNQHSRPAAWAHDATIQGDFVARALVELREGGAQVGLRNVKKGGGTDQGWLVPLPRGRTCRVELQRTDGHFTARIDGREVEMRQWIWGGSQDIKGRFTFALTGKAELVVKAVGIRCAQPGAE